MLVGRDAETAAIAEALAHARRGQASSLMLAGEPGMGKTMLLKWALERADGFTRIPVSGTTTDATLGYAGLLQVVRPLTGHLERLPVVPAAVLRGVCSLGPAPDVVDRLGIHVAVLLLLAGAAEQGPVLVTVDDVQWLDVESRDALLFTARHLDSDAVAMLFAARAGQAEDGRVVGTAHLPVLRLDGLRIPAATELLHDVSGVRPPNLVASSLVAATNGNPLALEEVAKRLTRGQLSGTDPLPSSLPLTATASQAYADLMDRLPVPTLDALGLFALADGDDAAAAFAAAADLGLSDTGWVTLESLGLLRVDEGKVRLRHALLVTAAVARLTPTRQRQMHRAIATALADTPAGDARLRRAWHLAGATQIPNEDVAAALAAVATDRQRTSGYAAAALAHERAATLTPDRPTRARRYQAAADAASMAGFNEWSLQLLTRAREQVEDPVFQARLDHARGVRNIVAGRSRAAWTLLPDSAEVLLGHDPHQAALVLADAALAAFLAGRLQDARATAERAHRLSAQAGVNLAASIVEALAALHLGDLVPALQQLAALGALPDLPNLLDAAIEYIVPLTIGLTWSGNCEVATSIADRVVGLLRSSGALGILPAALYASAYANVWQGRLRTAFVQASEAKALADEGNNRLWQFLAAGCLALAEAMRGNQPECRRLAASAQQTWADLDLWHPRDVEDALGLLALCAGDAPAALRYLERSSTPQPLSPPVFGRPSTVDLVEAHVRAKRAVPDTLARRIEGAVPEDFPAVAAAVWRCRGLIGACDPGEAFEAAITRYARANLPWQEARTRLNYGEQLRRSGHRVDARRQLQGAVHLFDDTGSPVWADRAAAELAAAGGDTTKRTRSASTDVLTPQELHVALAVAEGATNRETSTTLFLSPKTVEMHLTRIYRKLGVRSRTELAARLARPQVSDQAELSGPGALAPRQYPGGQR